MLLCSLFCLVDLVLLEIDAFWVNAGKPRPIGSELAPPFLALGTLILRELRFDDDFVLVRSAPGAGAPGAGARRVLVSITSIYCP